MCNAPKSEHNIDNFQYTQFIKSTRLNKPMQLSSLPPTNAAAQSCHQEWEWILQNDILEPTTTLLPPAQKNCSIGYLAIARKAASQFVVSVMDKQPHCFIISRLS
jgi:hypothetical protein